MKKLNLVTTFNPVKKVNFSLLSSKSLKSNSLYSQVKLVKKMQCSPKNLEKIKVWFLSVLELASTKHLLKVLKSVKNLYSLTKKITLLQHTPTGQKKSNIYFQVYSIEVLV